MEVRLGREDVISAWAGLLGNLDATQHLVANHLVHVDGDTAFCTASFQATHLLANPHGGPIWTLGGHYEFGLARTAEGWRITSVKMIADWATGNQQIMTLAGPKPS
jgi:ketosteroid isomerase-like protein